MSERNEEAVQEEARLRDEASFAATLDRTRSENPTCTIILIIANIGMVLVLFGMGGLRDTLNLEIYRQLGAIRAPEVLGGEYWRLLSAAFLHLGFLHLLFNMWALWDIGSITERIYGRLSYAVIYVSGAVIGGVGSVLSNADNVVSAGASGAIFGLCGALGAFLLRFQDAMPAQALRRLWWSVGGLVAYSLMLGATQPGIDNAAHIGGLLGGAATGFMLATGLEQKLPPARDLRRVLVGACVAALVLAVLQGIDPAGAPRLIRQGLRQFAAEEKRLADVELNILFTTLNQAHSVRRVERETLPAWAGLARMLDHLPVDPADTYGQKLALARAYATLKAQSLHSQVAEQRQGTQPSEASITARRVAVERAQTEYRNAGW